MLSDAVKPHLGSCDAVDLVRLLIACGRALYYEEGLVQGVSDRLIDRSPELNTQDIANIMMSCGRLYYDRHALFSALYPRLL